MADTTFTHDMSANYPVVLKARKMFFQAFEEMFWGPFAKFNTEGSRPIKPGNDPKPVNSPIVMQYELEKQAGDVIEIPMLMNLDQLPTIGEAQLEDHEERPKVNFANVPIELLRHAEKPKLSSISEQVNKDLMLVENAEPMLRRHYARSLEYLVFSYALYYGYSWHVLNSGRFTNDTKVAATPHPHIYCAGAGKVSYSGGNPGTTGYRTSVGTAIDAVGVSNVFNTDFLSALSKQADIIAIPRIIAKEGNEFLMLVAHPYQIATLEADPKFDSRSNNVMVQQMAKENPYFVGAKYFHHGFAIYEKDTVAWPCRKNATTGYDEWGPATISALSSFRAYTDDTKFAGVILGNNALFCAIGSALQFVKNMKDYRQILGIAYDVIQAASRYDFKNRDYGTAGASWENDRSAIFVTSAPAPVF